MEKNARIYIAGHRGLVGSALERSLRQKGYDNLLLRTHAELDLTDQKATEEFFAAAKPEYVIVAAAKVGGIHANNTYPAEFIRNNLAIELNTIHSAWKAGVKRLLFLGSSCIYPKLAPQPMREDHLLTGPLEPTNRPYALSKIAGIEMCWSYNRQYGTKYLAVMPANLYGPGDNYHPQNSHVIPALLRKFHEAKTAHASAATVWGTGNAMREFLYSEDMADACVFLMNLPDEQYNVLLGSDESQSGKFEPPLVNIGTGQDLTIRELAFAVRDVVGYRGDILFDTEKPDGAPRKLLDTHMLVRLGWQPATGLKIGLERAYRDFLAAETAN